MSDRAFGPFISPDGTWVGFDDESDNTLKRVSILGGPAVTICSTGTRVVLGASWGEDGTIIFGTFTASGLWRVPDSGGKLEQITTPDPEQEQRVNHAWPHILPGGRAVLFTIITDGTIENAQIAVSNLDTGEQHVLVPGGSHPRYSPTGHIIYGVSGTLRAGRMKSAHTPARIRSDARRFGARSRERLRMSNCCLTRSDSATTAGAHQPSQGGDQVDEQDEQVAHRHILATSPGIAKLDNLTGLRGCVATRHPHAHGVAPMSYPMGFEMIAPSWTTSNIRPSDSRTRYDALLGLSTSSI